MCLFVILCVCLHCGGGAVGFNGGVCLDSTSRRLGLEHDPGTALSC